MNFEDFWIKINFLSKFCNIVTLNIKNLIKFRRFLKKLRIFGKILII